MTANRPTRADLARPHRRSSKPIVLVVASLMIVGQLLATPAAFGSVSARAHVFLATGRGAPAPQTRNATFGIQPASAAAPDRRGYFTISGTPGGHVTDYFAINNYSLRPLTLTVGASDGLNTPEGDFALLPPTQKSKDLGTWISLTSPSMTVVVPGRGYRIVPFRIAIPLNAQPGDHAAGLTVTLASIARSASGQKYKLLQTVGSRVFLRVSGDLRPALAVDVLGVRYRGTLNPVGLGRALVTYRVRNVGNVALGGVPTVGAHGVFGIGQNALEQPQLGLLLPGYSVEKRAEVRGFFPLIWMTAKVSIKPLILPGTVQPVDAAYVASSHFWSVPWVLLGVIVLLIGALRRRRRSRKRPEPTDAKPKKPVVSAPVLSAQAAASQKPEPAAPVPPQMQPPAPRPRTQQVRARRPGIIEHRVGGVVIPPKETGEDTLSQ